MSSTNPLSILSKCSIADLRLEPFPHLVVENALDPALYEQLESCFPSDALIVDDRPIKDTWFDFPACKVVDDQRIAAIWRDFFRHHTSSAFFSELIALVGPVLRQLHPDLERRLGKPLSDFKVGMRPGGRGDPLAPGADVSMECQFYANYSRAARTVRGPHIDRPSELFAALLYFRQPDDDSTGADLDICEADESIYSRPAAVRIDELPAEVCGHRVRVVRTAPYKANTLVLFLNSRKSLHAVSPRSPTSLTRRHINFCADVPLDLFEIDLPIRLSIKKSLESKPILWRLAQRL